ncbi:sugar phosphate isomerase/epimerase family protein [Lignipirellula cremea]|uniref:Xylose isomerase-like TIM barrel n=1 Tax=Lignipirellula cremea TaxID=2528010 RepID=A0A518DPK4_9BACT|nr:sugar phosphate isomerase/epimerase family protein [Lignipirellula cremea]QDU93764.1 Xylose isomerase-like TIM barrel [Lignipirellula cremea]
MSRPVDRRSFLMQGAALTGAAAFASPLAAIEPITRNGKSKFKFSLAAYSYRKLLTDSSSGVTLSTFVQDCAAMGLEGTELTSYYFPAAPEPKMLHDLRKECFYLGLDVSGTAIRNDFGVQDEAKLRAEIDHVKKWVDYADMLSAPVIRIFTGHVAKGDSPEASHRRMVKAMEECCDYAGQHGVILALENHGGPTATAEGLLAFVSDINSPWFAVNLDSGNFHTEDPYGDLAKVAPYAANVQIKIVMSGPGKKGKEPADYKRLAAILKDVDYRGYIVLEYEEAGEPRAACREHMDQLRQAFA